MDSGRESVIVRSDGRQAFDSKKQEARSIK